MIEMVEELTKPCAILEKALKLYRRDIVPSSSSSSATSEHGVGGQGGNAIDVSVARKTSALRRGYQLILRAAATSPSDLGEVVALSRLQRGWDDGWFRRPTLTLFIAETSGKHLRQERHSPCFYMEFHCEDNCLPKLPFSPFH